MLATLPAPDEKDVSPEALPPGHVLVRAPMLGTFHRSPEPGGPPFAEPATRWRRTPASQG